MTELPIGWKSLKLSEVAKWGSGGTPKSSDKTLYGGGIPWVVIGDLTEGVVSKTAQSITKKGLENSSAKLFPPSTIMLAMYGASIGRTGIMATSMTTNQAIACATVNRDVIDNGFLLLYLQSQKENFIRAGKGGAQPNISQTVIKDWVVPVPPIAEQHQIVEVLEDHLSRLDAALDDVKQAKTKAAQFKVSFLREVFSGDSTWNSIPIKNIGKWTGGGTPSKANPKFWTDGTVPWLSPKDMGSMEISKTEDLITEEAISNSTVKRIAANSVVFVVRSGILERKLPVALTRIETTLNQDMKAITFATGVLPKFGFFSMLAFEQDILTKCRKSGTTVASIDTAKLMNYEIRIPDLETQKKVLHYVESQISLVDLTGPSIGDALKIGQKLRRSLLQTAFTGQLTRKARNV